MYRPTFQVLTDEDIDFILRDPRENQVLEDDELARTDAFIEDWLLGREHLPRRHDVTITDTVTP